YSGRPVSPDSPFDEARADIADRLGPSREACNRLVTAFKETMPDVEVGEATADADRAEGRWRCVAEAEARSRTLRVVVTDRLQSVTLRVPGLATRLRSKEGIGLTLSEGTARWDRPQGFTGTDEFTVRY
ncbi:MAG TPA: hypothetical protein VJV75_01230, partial [Candidatus Polarisedimenticolia bacterium]|nr:hypothetical protein [Candidatus Polarisedimenticolia bacterium]